MRHPEMLKIVDFLGDFDTASCLFLKYIDNQQVTSPYIRFRAHTLVGVEFCQTFRRDFCSHS